MTPDSVCTAWARVQAAGRPSEVAVSRAKGGQGYVYVVGKLRGCRFVAERGLV